MAEHTFKGKRKLCYTEVADFTNYQGIGHDPLYKRYDSVFSVVKHVVPLEYQHFLTTPQYLEEEDQICWHINEWEENPMKLTELTGNLREKYERIKNETIRAYQLAAQNANGEDLMILAGAIKYRNDDCIYCCDGKVYLVAWGMTPDIRQHQVNGSIIHEFDFVKKFKITFETGEHGQLVSKLDRTMTRTEGFVLSQRDLPQLSVDEGWKFEGWSPVPLGIEVKSDLHFKALYSKEKILNSEVPPVIPDQPVSQEPRYYICHFDAGKHGKLEGSENVRKEENTILGSTEIPQINANVGYEFKGWNVSPLNMLVDSDKSFVAHYKRTPWYRRWWLWLTGLFAGRGCLRWLLWLLLFVLLFWVLSFFLRSCVGCGHQEVNGVTPIDSTTTSNGRVVENNGRIHPITGDDGKLPDAKDIVAPVVNENGDELPIIRQPGVPNTIANRLFRVTCKSVWIRHIFS